jgi:peptide/nickel transport system ATP-binding protein
MEYKETFLTEYIAKRDTMSNILLDIQGLSISYPTSAGAIAAVSDVALAVPAGAVVGLVGESGSGKSTLASALLGLLPAQAIVRGSIRLDGREIVGLAEDDQARVVRWRQAALVFQQAMSALSPVHRIGDQLGDVLRHHQPGLGRREVAARLAALMQRVNLPPSALRTYPHELSGGMRQRAMIALCLLLDPPLVIFDEATSSLDTLTQREVLDELRRLQRELGLALLLIAHDLALVAEYADSVAVMRAGRIVEAGPTAEVLSDPQHFYTRALRGAALSLEPPHPATPGPEHAKATGAPLLCATNLRRRYRRDLCAVDGVSLTLGSGEIVALLGASGSGKSTLARLLARLEPADRGRIKFEGQDVTQLGGRLLRPFRRAVGYVFQNPFEAFDPRLSVAEALERPLAIHQIGADSRQRRRIIAEALAQVGLAPPEQFMERLPHQVSGGQLQRIAIVRATLTSPRLLIADEPISMLDASLRRGIIDLLRDLRDRAGTTVLFITHDLAAAQAIADRIAVLDGGQLVELAPTRALVQQPRHSATRALLAAAPRVLT